MIHSIIFASQTVFWASMSSLFFVFNTWTFSSIFKTEKAIAAIISSQMSWQRNSLLQDDVEPTIK